jgi:hypothetical protein
VSRIRQATRALGDPALAAPLSIALLALLASGPSIINGFVYDDLPIVAYNSRVHTLARWWDAFGRAYWPPHWGNANYRPLTILSFAAEWAIGGGSPLVFHAVSVALYIATCIAVLRLAQLVLPTSAAWVVAALFAVHPVHVEAVANVVGQSELLVALCFVLATAAYVQRRTKERGTTTAFVAAIGGLYAVACFSKETGFLLPAVLLAAELTVIAARLDSSRRTVAARMRELSLLYGVCAALGLGYLMARRWVLHGVGDLPSVVLSQLSTEGRLLTMLGVVPEWARLFLWPAALSGDYSPPRIPLILSATAAVIPGLVMLIGCVVVAAAGLRTQRRVGTFGLLWLAITIFPVSNVVMSSGVLLAERTLFLPSVGVLLAIGSVCAWGAARMAVLRRPRPHAVALSGLVALVILLALGVGKSAMRSRVWRNSDAFFQQIVEDAPLSYRAQHVHGMWLFAQGRRAEGEQHVRAAIAMFPHDAGPYTDLADQYRFAGLCAPARELYRRAMELGRLRDRARIGLVVCLLHDAQYAEAAAEARVGASSATFQAEQFKRLAAIADSALAVTTSVRQSGAARQGTR